MLVVLLFCVLCVVCCVLCVSVVLSGYQGSVAQAPQQVGKARLYDDMSMILRKHVEIFSAKL